MTVRRWLCERHGYQPTKIIGRDDIPRCPECGHRMERVEYGVEHPPKESRQ